MPVREITVEQLAEALAGGAPPSLVDVRTEGEHEIAALPASILVPLHELEGRVEELSHLRDGPVVVYCHHGVRSKSGAAILSAAGFRDVVSLRGGIDAWTLRIDPTVPRY